MEELKNILNEIIKDYGLKILEDPQKFKAIFADYAKGEYSAEKELFTKLIETGAAKEIKETEDIPTTKKTLVKKLHDKYFLDEKIINGYLDIFIMLLKSDYKINSYVREETQEKESIVRKPAIVKPAIKHISSVKNSWSFDVPVLFEAFHKNFKDIKNYTTNFGKEYFYMVYKCKKGNKPSFNIFTKKIQSLSDYNYEIVKTFTILNQKSIKINGLKAEYYQLQTENGYLHIAYLEKDDFFYNFWIGVPLEKKSEYQEQMDAFIYSVKIT